MVFCIYCGQFQFYFTTFDSCAFPQLEQVKASGMRCIKKLMRCIFVFCKDTFNVINMCVLNGALALFSFNKRLAILITQQKAETKLKAVAL